eukprot:GEMP01015482.1.p1 GENE.GEMP01015482.1~~GEMP01015482.1.p1  ORF type:complete len:496 (+),score=124.17 GEMP01015482.1:202-1689(+)
MGDDASSIGGESSFGLHAIGGDYQDDDIEELSLSEEASHRTSSLGVTESSGGSVSSKKLLSDMIKHLATRESEASVRASGKSGVSARNQPTREEDYERSERRLRGLLNDIEDDVLGAKGRETEVPRTKDRTSRSWTGNLKVFDEATAALYVAKADALEREDYETAAKAMKEMTKVEAERKAYLNMQKNGHMATRNLLRDVAKELQEIQTVLKHALCEDKPWGYKVAHDLRARRDELRLELAELVEGSELPFAGSIKGRERSEAAVIAAEAIKEARCRSGEAWGRDSSPRARRGEAFKDFGKPTGRVKGLIKTDGGVYSGFWNKTGRREGFGVIQGREGAVFAGQWQDDRRHGRGTLYFPGGVFEGEWTNGLANGTGTIHFDNGDVFHGTYMNDKKEDTGMYVWANGSSEVGVYKNGVKHGVHEWKHDDNTWFVQYNVGKLVKSTPITTAAKAKPALKPAISYAATARRSSNKLVLAKAGPKTKAKSAGPKSIKNR